MFDDAENVAPFFFGLLLLAATGVTLWNLAKTVPGQNAAAAAALVGGVEAVALGIGVKTGVPFGPFFYTDKCGPIVFGALAWYVPFLWVVILFNARGVARLILRPWRRISTYGFRVIGLTLLLSVIFDFGLEAYAGRAARFWIWNTNIAHSSWYGAPWVNFVSQTVLILLILIFATPWLIKRKPGVPSKPDFMPLAVWLVLNIFLAALNAMHHLWYAAALSAVLLLASSTLAWKNTH